MGAGVPTSTPARDAPDPVGLEYSAPVTLSRAAALAALLLLFAAPTRAAVQATLFGSDLHPQRVTLQSLRNDTISYFGEDREYRSIPVRKLLQLRCDNPLANPTGADAAIIELTDGRQFRGRSLGATDAGQTLRWQHPALGEMTFALERLRSWRRDGATTVAASAEEDRITFTNGDQMTGFIANLTDQGLRLRLPRQEEPVAFPFDRIASVEFANPPAATAPVAHLVHFIDGTRARFETLAIEGNVLTLGVTDPVRINVDSLLRIDFVGGEAQLLDLAAVPWQVVSGGDVFGMPMPPRFDGGVLRLHAPVVVRFNLPARARRVAMILELDAGARDRVRWADVHAVIETGAKTPARVTLDAQHREISLNLLVAAPDLTVRLDSSGNGPIMDRVRIRDAVVLVGE